MAKLGNDFMDEMVDINAVIAPLWAYAFAAVSGTATLTGFYVDPTGIQIGALFSYSISTATTLTALYNTANSLSSTTPLPSNIVGAYCALSGSALWMGRGGLINGSIASGLSPVSGYPQLATSNYLTIGRTSP